MFGLGVATLATLSLFSANTISQTTGKDLTAKGNDKDSARQRLARHTQAHCSHTPTGVGGVRG